jgi:hypothetical protein
VAVEAVEQDDDGVAGTGHQPSTIDVDDGATAVRPSR